MSPYEKEICLWLLHIWLRFRHYCDCCCFPFLNHAKIRFCGIRNITYSIFYILECYVYRLHSPCNFWKFNSSGLKVRPDWMPFFVQNHCKFYNKFIEIREFNWKYRHIGKNVEDYIHIGCFHHAIFGSSTCRLKVRSDWMSFFCKITAKFIKCSIANRCLFTFIQYL